MGRINILDQQTINKIAAGEVVQNAASIVKELVENSIDARASGITVEIEQGGKKKLRVTDNGSGIPAQDVERAFLRHATSKIANADDIENILSLGFRGEALSSISAVSMLELKTKTAEEEMGTVFSVNGGTGGEIKPAGLPEGTTITVSNLFYNTPARLKFLKSQQAETGYVTEVVAKFIIAFPEIAFHYISNGETVFRSPGTGSVEDALVAVYGRQIIHRVVFVNAVSGGVTVSGYIGLPQFALKNRRHQSFFVNRRYVKNLFLSNALSNAYSERILRSHYPFAMLFIETSPKDIDVNVHPQKLEVKFRNEQSIADVITEAVDGALRSSAITGRLQGLNDTPATAPAPSTAATLITNVDDGLFEGFKLLKQTGSPIALAEQLQVAELLRAQPESMPQEPPKEQPSAGEQRSTFIGSGNDVALRKDEYKVIGVLFHSYLLIEQGDMLLIIDQHAAHERVLYDRLMAAIASREAMSQLLMVSELYTCTAEEMELFQQNSDVFRDIGFDIELFGQNQLKISAVPLTYSQLGIQALMDELFFELSHNRGGNAVIRRDRLLSAMCRKAIKAEDALSPQEIAFIIDGYIETGEYPTCPHGRPIVTAITQTELEKSFKRRV